MQNATLTTEAKRLFKRYQIEIVETLVICPYAARARLENAVRIEVITHTNPPHTAVIELIEAIAQEVACDIGFVIFPRFECSRSSFERFVETLRSMYSAQHQHRDTELALAAFHPEAAYDASAPHTLVPYWRRTPDPTLQTIRLSALERVRKGESSTIFVPPEQIPNVLKMKHSTPLHARIAENNYQTAQKLGAETLQKMFEDIMRDRQQTYGS